MSLSIKTILSKSIRNIMKEKIHFNIVKDACLHQYKKYADTNMYITPLMDLNHSIDIGIPMSIKDLYLTKNILTTAASKMLSNFIAPYDSTLVTRLENVKFVNFGKVNLDEFAMGSSGITSYYGPTRSIWFHKNGEVFSPGGSSSGSAISVATGSVFVSLGTDTSGSIRLPASHCGIVGFKPTYGVLSRFGIIPLAESLDHPGFLTRLVDDARYMFECSIGKDNNDLTSVDYKEHKSNKKKFGILKESYEATYSINEQIKKVEKCFEEQGYEKKTYSIPELEMAIAIYVILCRAECSSNLQRYDGLRYGFSAYGNNLEEQYLDTRTEAFGLEVQRRIMIGGFVTSSENIQVYLDKAQKLRQLIKVKILKIFEEVDFILMPTTMGAMTVQECKDTNLQDPIKMQKQDLFTVIANLCGFPAISVPVFFDDKGSPVGVDIMGAPFQDLQIMEFAEIVEKEFPIHAQLIKKITEEK